MNWVPLLFFDDVCHQLNRRTLNQITQLSGSWSTFGAQHHKKRREFDFRCGVSDQEVSYDLRDNDYSRKVTVADLNLEFDRITALAFDYALPSGHRVSLREFERVVLPTVASLVTNCCSPYSAARDYRIFFNAFKNCPGFNDITVTGQGPESRDFLARQVELGNVERLKLYGADNWPEAENLAETLKIFMSSTRFLELYSPDLLIDGCELFELFLERAVAGELKRGARITAPGTNLDESRLLALRPECRHNSEGDAWRIPDSNLRIALFHLSGMLYVRVELRVEVELKVE